MKVENTKDPAKVEAIRQWSIQLVNEGKAEEIKNWDAKSTWHNSKFTRLSTNQQWVVYLADQAWPGEVKLITTNNQQNITSCSNSFAALTGPAKPPVK